MGRIALLVTGTILGVGAGYFLFGNNTGLNPEPAVSTAPAAPEFVEPEPSNPFATTAPEAESQVVENTLPTPIATSANADEQPSAQPEAQSTTTDPNHYRSLVAYLNHIENADSSGLRNMLEQLPGGYNSSPYQQAKMTAVYQRWAEIDIDTALTYAIDSIKGRNSYSGEAGIGIIAQANPEYVRQRVEEISPNERDRLQHAVISGIIASDPKKYIEEALANGGLANGGLANSGQDSYQVEMAFMQWTEQDPAAAYNFLKSEPDTDLSQMFQDQVLYMWLEQDPDTALPEIEAMLSNSDNRPDQHAMLSDLYVSHLSRTDPDAAMQWAMSQENPMVRENALMSALHGVEYQDPDNLLALMDQLGPEEKNRLMPMMAPTIASSMARTDPLGAMAWVEQFEQSDQHTGAKMSVFNEWVNTDPDSATAWLMNQPPSSDHTFMLQDAIYPLMERNPQAASALFQQLPPDMQVEMVEPMMYSFSQRQPDAAQQWLSNQSSEVQLFGSIMLDTMNPNADTYTTLEKIMALPQGQGGGQRENYLFNFVSQRGPQHKDEIARWLADTSQLTDEERQVINDITNSYGHYGGRYGGGYGFDSGGYYQRIEPVPGE